MKQMTQQIVQQKQIRDHIPSLHYRNLSEADFELAQKVAPCLAMEENDPFPPAKIGISIFTKPQHPASLYFYRLRNHRSFAQKIKDWVEAWFLTLYHTVVNDRKTERVPFALYKFYRNRPQPVLMQIRDKWKKKKAAKVIEYAIYYDSDIGHVYDLEHVWVYLDDRDEIIGVKGSRHGVIVTQYASRKDIRFFKGHPLIFSTPGKHSNIVSLKQLNRRVLTRACRDMAGSKGIYDVQFFDDELRERIKVIDPGKDKIHRVYNKKYAFKPTFRYTRYLIPKRNIMTSWNDLMHWIPERLIEFVNDEIKPEI